MAHNLTFFQNENGDMAYVGDRPWHGLEQELEANQPIEAWIRAAGLDWEARKSPVDFLTEKGVTSFKGQEVLYRSDTGKALSVVSSRYNPVQPKEVMNFFKDIVEIHDAFSMETAGIIDNGKRIWALAKSRNGIALGDDKLEKYLLLTTTYDKSDPTRVIPTTVRVVCQNTLHLSLRAKKNHISVFHNRKFDAEAIKKQLNIDDEFLLFGERVEKLANTKVTRGQAVQFYTEILFGKDEPEDDDEKTNRMKVVDKIYNIYRTAPGQELETTKGTAWGLVNAVTYQIDHKDYHSVNNKLRQSWFGVGARLKDKAFTAALSI